MNEFLSDLLLLTLGATLAPIYPIGLLLLLQGERGLARAIAFVSGAVALVAFAIAPQQSAKPLQAARVWLQRHNRRITIVVSLLFGAIFLYKGIAGLVALNVS